MKSLLLPAATAAVTTMVLMPLMRRVAIQHGYLDVPNDRSSHDRPTPRIGGYAMLAGVAAGAWAAAVWRDGAVAVILIGAVVLAGVAFLDDRRALPRLLRLVVQLSVAGLVVWGISQAGAPVWPSPPALAAIAWVFALVWVVGVINAYNFMDGLNGMAGLAAVVTGSVLAVLALRRGDPPAAALAISVAAAAAGFLPFNLFSGSTFMGDSGSTVLGLVFGALVLDANGPGIAAVSAALPLAPFLLDAGTTIVRRALRGERFFATRHRSSYYQLLQQQGWSHAAVAGLYAALTATSAAVALAFDGLSSSQRAAALAALAVGHAAVFAGIQAGWSRHVRHGAVGG